MRGDKTEHAVINGPVRNRLNKHLISYLKLQEWLKKSHISSARVYLNLGKIKIFDVYKSAVCTMYVLLKQTSKKKTDMNKEVLEKFRWWRHKHGLFLYIQHIKNRQLEKHLFHPYSLTDFQPLTQKSMFILPQVSMWSWNI